MKTISILGSTGSIGIQALEIIRQSKLNISIDYLYTNTNYKELYKQICEFSPKYVCINNEESYDKLNEMISNDHNTKIIVGRKNSLDFISSRDIDLSLNAIVGVDGLHPTLALIENKIDIALSNKESLVLAGEIVMNRAKEKKVNIFPVDSEHSAIWQCLRGENEEEIRKLILTASGGPFRKLDFSNFSKITKKDALNHPNWDMGNKITIDSSTMMNKGFEVIETKWLFNIDSSQIDIIVHPESIIHSMVEFKDRSIKAQLGLPDMKIPINYALNYPKHSSIEITSLDLTKIKNLTFEKPDLEKFKCIDLAYQALQSGGSSPTVLNISNDIAVDLFLNNKIQFLDIPTLIEKSIEKHDYVNSPSLDDINNLMQWTSNFINEEILC